MMFEDPYDEAPPSKSQRKRDAHALQELGESLVNLNKSALAKIPMPDDLRMAISKAQHTQQRGALKRQIQYIGKLMRQLDDIAILRQAYEQVTHPFQENVEHHHLLEDWRDRLLAEGDSALEQLLSEYPQTDRQHIRQLLRTAHKEAEANKPPKSARELFRYLRELIRG